MKFEKNSAEKKILASALSHFSDKTGIAAKLESNQLLISTGFRADALISIVMGKVETPFLVEVKNRVDTLRDIELFLSKVPSGILPLVVAKIISSQAKESLLRRGVAYIDQSGDFYLPILSGKHPSKNSPMERKKVLSRSPKSLPQLKMAFAFLRFPETKQYPLKILATTLNLSMGSVSEIKNNLLSTGTLEETSNAWMRWATTYVDFIKFHKSYYLGCFRCEKLNLAKEWKKIAVKELGAVWGGEPGAALVTRNLNPEHFTIYIEGGLQKLIVKLGLVPDKNGNLQVHKAFWSDTTLDEGEKNHANLLVIFADLIFSKSSRNRLVAREVFASTERK